MYQSAVPGAGDTIEYMGGDEWVLVREGGSRSWRLGNPGLLGHGLFAVEHGAIGAATGIAIFRDDAAGLSALEAMLGSADFAGRTVEQAYRAFAPITLPRSREDPSLPGACPDTGLDGAAPMQRLSAADRAAMALVIRRALGWQVGREYERKLADSGRGQAPGAPATNILINGRTAVHGGSGGVLQTADICRTRIGKAWRNILYANVARSTDADATASTVLINGHPACHAQSTFSRSTGDEPGTGGGIVSGTVAGAAQFITASPNVFFEGVAAVRQFDLMTSNWGNTGPMPLMQPGARGGRGGDAGLIPPLVAEPEPEPVTEALRLLPVRLAPHARAWPAVAARSHQLDSHRLAIAPLRAGYLYLMVEEAGGPRLIEYALDGTFHDDALASPLVLPEGQRHGIVRVCYSEIRLTPRKRERLLANPADRDTVMHPLPPAGSDTEVRLLPPDAVDDMVADDQLLAEIARVPQPAGVTVRVLVVPDDLGMLRALSDAQQALVDDLDSDRYLQYLQASFIESLTTLDTERLHALREDEALGPHLAPVLDYIAGLDPERAGECTRQLLDLLNIDRPGPEEVTAVDRPEPPPANVVPLHGPGQVHHPAQERERWQAWLQAQLPAFDSAFIDANFRSLWRLHAGHRRQIRRALGGSLSGRRGIDQLIRRDALDAFMQQEGPAIGDWHRQLDAITADRVRLITTNRFHRTAWLFDGDHPEQLEAALGAEYHCLRDLPRNEAHDQALFDWVDANPMHMLSAAYTLPAAAREEIAEILIRALRAGHSLYQGWEQIAPVLSHHRLPDAGAEGSATRQLSALIQDVYGAAVHGLEQRRIDELLATIRGKLDGVDADALIRGTDTPGPAGLASALNNATRLRLLQTIHAHGITVQLAGADALQGFSATVDTLLAQRAQLRSINNRLRHPALDDAQRRSLADERRQLQTALRDSESRLAQALLPIDSAPPGEKPGRIGVTLTVPDATVAEELRHAYANPGDSAHFRPSRLSAWDGLALLLFAVQVDNLLEATRALVDSWGGKQQPGVPVFFNAFNSLTAASATGFSAAQAIGWGVLTLRVDHFRHPAVALGALHVFIGGAAYAFGAASSAFGVAVSGKRWVKALREGNRQGMAASTVGIVATAGQSGVQTWGASASLGQALRILKAPDAVTRQIAWAAAGSRLSTVFWRVNLLGAVFTVLELTAWYWLNTTERSALQRWLERSHWGRKPGPDSLADQLGALTLLLRPRPTAHLAVDRGSHRILLTLPAVTLSSLDDAAVRCQAWRLQSGSRRGAAGERWEDWSEEFIHRSLRASEPDMPLTLAVDLTPEEVDGRIGLAFSLTEQVTDHRGDAQRITTHLRLVRAPGFMDALRNRPASDGTADFEQVEQFTRRGANAFAATPLPLSTNQWLDE